MLSLQDMFRDLEPPGFNITLEQQPRINETFIKAHKSPKAWAKYRQYLEKNYTLEDFRPHYVRTFVNIPISFYMKDISNYTKALAEIDDDVYNY